MGLINNSDIENNSYTFFGPIEMAFHDDGNALQETDTVKILLSSCWAISMIIGLFGNVCTCAVISRYRTMRTPTNCYLFNLAITDLMMASFVPIEVYILWMPDYYPFGEEGCRFHYLLSDLLSNCSVLTILAFTVERYLVVSKPFLRQKLRSKSRVIKIILVIWVISCAFCIPDMFYIDLLERKKFSYCYITVPDHLEPLVIVEVFVFFVVPMSVIAVLYVLIALKLKSAHCKLRSNPVVNGNQSRDKAVKMLAAVAAMFFFCWAPFCLYRILVVTPLHRDDNYYDMWRILTYMGSINVYISTAVNPILYSLMSHKFRQAFKDLIKGNSLTTISSMRPSFGATLTSTIRTNSNYTGVKSNQMSPQSTYTLTRDIV